MSTRVLAPCLGVLLFASPVQATSGFVRDPGTGYAKLTFVNFVSNDYYALNGELRDGGQKLSQRALALYLEYGIAEHFSAAVGWWGARWNAFSGTSTAFGVGDLALELKVGTSIADWHVAFSETPEIPLGRSVAFVSTNDGGRINLPTGDGEWNFWSRFAIARSVDAIDGWVSADLGYNLRTEGFTDQLGFSAEIGRGVFDVFWIVARVRGLIALSSHANPNVPFLYGEGTEYLAADVGITIPLVDRLSVTGDLSRQFAERRNVYSGWTIGAGVATQW